VEFHFADWLPCTPFITNCRHLAARGHTTIPRSHYYHAYRPSVPSSVPIFTQHQITLALAGVTYGMPVAVSGDMATPAWQFTAMRRGAASCPACGGPEEDATHFVFTCGALHAVRDHMYSQLDSITSGAFGQLMFDEPLDTVLLGLLGDNYRGR
jgi:hypothetical protein